MNVLVYSHGPLLPLVYLHEHHRNKEIPLTSLLPGRVTTFLVDKTRVISIPLTL